MSGLVFSIVGYRPDYGVHPGETLREMLDAAGMTQSAIAEACGVSQKHISEVVNGKAGIGPALALGLEATLHVDAVFWVRMQATYDVWRARQARRLQP